MLKMTIDGEEVVSKNNFTIKEEMLSHSSTILNNTYPKEWEDDKDYTSRFYYPKDYAKLNIQNFSITPEEAGTTIQINSSATLTDVDTTKESRVLRLLGQTSQTGTPTPTSPIPVNVVSGDNSIEVMGKNLLDIGNSISGYFATTNNGLTINTSVDISTYVSATFDNNTITITNYNNSGYRWLSKLVKLNKNTTYTISSGELSQGVLVCGCNSLENGTTSTQLVRIDNQNLRPPKTFNSGNYEYYYIAIYPQQTGNVYPNIMVEANSTATTYEPYIGNTYPIYLGVENLFNEADARTKSNAGANVTLMEIQLKPNTQYTFSRYVKEQLYVNLGFYLFFAKSETPTTVMFALNYGSSASEEITSLSTTITTGASGLIYLRGTYANNTRINDYLDKVNVQIEVGSKANSYSVYGTTPIELCKIVTYQDKIYKGVGSNLLDTSNITANTGLTSQGGTFSSNDYCIENWLSLKPNTQYILSDNDNTKTKRICFYSDNNENSFISVVEQVVKSVSFTTPSNCKYVRIQIKQTELNSCMLNEGTTALPYEPYNAKDKWLLHKEIGKVVLDGSESWTEASSVMTGTKRYYYNKQDMYADGNGNLRSNMFKNCSWDAIYNANRTDMYLIANNGSTDITQKRIHIRIDETVASTVANFKTWLSTNKPLVYYQLSTPTTTLITDTILISQLDALESQ